MADRVWVGIVYGCLLLTSVAWAENFTISMKGRVFTPQKIVVKVGDTVQWVNEDTEIHQVISGRTPYDRDLGDPMNSRFVLWNQTYAFTLTKPGSYKYMCLIHRSLEDGPGTEGMIGEIVVEP
jgi:plastocyanin